MHISHRVNSDSPAESRAALFHLCFLCWKELEGVAILASQSLTKSIMHLGSRVFKYRWQTGRRQEYRFLADSLVVRADELPYLLLQVCALKQLLKGGLVWKAELDFRRALKKAF